MANMYIVQNPDSALSVALALLPFFAPMVMFIRILILTPPAWQIAASIGLLMVTIGLTVHLAARIFRVGMLMYGKRAPLSEVWKWIRYRGTANVKRYRHSVHVSRFTPAGYGYLQ